MRRRSLPWLPKAVALIASFGALLCLAITGLSVDEIVQAKLPSIAIAVVVLLSLAALWMVFSTLRGSLSVWRAAPLVGTPIMANGILAATGTAAPWMMPWSTLGIVVTPLLWKRRIALPWVLANTVAYGSVIAHSQSWPMVVVTAVIPAYGAVVVGWVVSVLVDRFGSVAGARRAADEDTGRAERQIAVQQARAWWNRMLHDKVIGALMLGARATSPRELALARAMAQEALSALRSSSPEPEPAPHTAGGELVDRIVSIAEAHGLTTELSTSGTVDPPAEVVAALVLAAEQALSNVARHAGVSTVQIEIARSATSATVVVRDEGRGFDTDTVDERRLGVRMSMPSHLADLSGVCSVHSVPGAGTSIELGWTAPVVPPSGMLGDRSRAPVWWFSLGWMVLHLIGAVAAGGIPTELPCVAALVVGLICAQLQWPPGASWLAVSLAVLATLVFALSLAVAPSGAWQGWLIGAGTPIFAILAARGLPTLAMILSIAVAAVVIVDAWARGGVLPAWASVLPVVALPGFVWLLATQFHRAHAELASARRRADAARRRAVSAEAVQALLNGRARQMDPHTVPLLEQLASGGLFLAADRERALLAEAANRDLLVARPLISTDVAQAAREARARQVIVHLTSTPTTLNEPDLTAEALMSIVRAELVEALHQAAPGDRVTARWHPAGRVAAATLAVTRADDEDADLTDTFVEFGPLNSR